MTIFFVILSGTVIGLLTGLHARVANVDRHLQSAHRFGDSLEAALRASQDVVEAFHEQLADANVRCAALQAELDAERAGGYHALVGKRVTASVTDGGSISGILEHVYDDAVVLSHPERVAGSGPVPLGGQMTIARSSVPILQRFEEE